jgi:membrane protein DedA with SNARE-associated domain
MSILTDIFAFIGSFVLSIISQLGYAGIFFLMMLESMIVPVPSEFVMPFAGFLVAQGSFNVVLVILVSTLGSITGSLLFYYIGTTGGLTLVQRYGKYVLVDTEDIKKTEAWFNKRGDLTIFLARLIPVVRHLISLIAGIAKMNVKKFTIYTIFGAALWNGILTYLGLFLGQHWDKVSQYMENLDLVIVILLIAGCLYFVYRHLRRAKKKHTTIKQVIVFFSMFV